MQITNDHKALIEAAVPEVAFDGWTYKALDRAAETIGMNALIARDYFPSGATEMITVHSYLADKAMIAAVTKDQMAELGTKKAIAALLTARFEANQASKEAVRRAVAVLALPTNAALASKLLFSTVDAVWIAVGDQSRDYNYYSKRMLLAAVYSSTLLIWLDDKSEDMKETRAFMDRRLNGVVSTFGRIGKLRSGMQKHFPNLPDPLGWIRAPQKKWTD